MGADMIVTTLVAPIGWTPPEVTDELVDTIHTSWCAWYSNASQDEIKYVDFELEEVEPESRMDAAKDVIREFLECLHWGREWTSVDVGPVQICITGGMSWGDYPSDSCYRANRMFSIDPENIALTSIGLPKDTTNLVWKEDAQ